MTLTTIAPGVRLLRRHTAADLLIVEGLGDYPTYLVESIPGGWCVVNGEQATTRFAEQIAQCERGMTPEEDMNLPDGWTCGIDGDWRGPDGASAVVEREGGSFIAIMYAPERYYAESAKADLLKMAAGLNGRDAHAEIANLIADIHRAHQQRDTAERQQADTFDALIAERKTSANLRAEVRRLQERGILKRLFRRVV